MLGRNWGRRGGVGMDCCEYFAAMGTALCGTENRADPTSKRARLSTNQTRNTSLNTNPSLTLNNMALRVLYKRLIQSPTVPPTSIGTLPSISSVSKPIAAISPARTSASGHHLLA